VRAVLIVLAAAMLMAGCADDPPPPASSTSSADILKRDCADPQWKQQNLGLWYSVCRQPLRW
jgi:PBP1b-binding outer membrane lipoprotein LpoB